MGALHKDVNCLHVENATSGRRSRGGGCSELPWLDLYAVDDDNSPSAAAIMADWPSWEQPSTTTSPLEQQRSGSPMLHSSSSQSSYEAPRRSVQADVSTSSRMQPPAAAATTAGSTTPTRSSLIETLQTVLRTTSSSSSPPLSRSPQQAQLGTSPRPLKRRSRASRRVPTMVLEASSSDFLSVVQRLTGVSAAAQAPSVAVAATVAPVRPLPTRPTAPLTTFIRPDRPTSSTSTPNSHVDIQSFSLSQLLAPSRAGSASPSSSSTFATPPPIVATAPSSWWESGLSNPIPPTHVDPPVPASAATPITFMPYASDSFTLAQFDAWFSAQDDT